MTETDGTIRTDTPAKGVALITIDRPDKRNALSPTMIADLRAAFDDAGRAAGVRAIIITGAGDKAFCTGHDIKAMAPGDIGHLYEEAHMQVFLAPRKTMKPVIAAINGAAYAGGLCLAIASDIRMATPAATFAVPGAKLGIVPIAGQSARLPHLLPAAIVNEMVMTGAPLTAERAHDVGFVNAIIDAGDLVARAIAMASEMAELSPVALQSYKRIAQATLYRSVAEADAMEYWLAMAAGHGADVREGLAAFAERRKPVFPDPEEGSS